MGVIFITLECKKHNKLYKTCKKECKKCAIFAHFIDIFLLTRKIRLFTILPPPSSFHHPPLMQAMPATSHHPLVPSYRKKGSRPTPGPLPLQGGHPADYVRVFVWFTKLTPFG